MKSLILPKISESLNKSKFKIKKSLGQNYIFDLNLTNKIVKNSMPFSKTIIEIGPGPGALTRSILSNGGKNVFVITPKGKQYLDQYRKFADVAESFGLEM